MKRDMKRIATIMIAGAMVIIPASVMAENTKEVQAEKIVEAAKIAPAKEIKKSYIEQKGTVLEVTKTEKGMEALVKVGEVNFRINLPKEILVINQGETKLATVEDVKKGAEIAFFTTETTPVALSEPALLTPEFVIINLGEKSSYVGKLDENFLNEEQDLKFTMDENTSIIPQNGTKIKLYPQDIVGKDVVAIYSIVATSIPAQTSPELVILLNAKQEVVAEQLPEVKALEVPIYKNKYGRTMVGFAATATNRGYEVAWNEAEKVATATKGKEVIKVALKQGTVSINGKNLETAYLMETKDGKLYLSEEAYAVIFPETAIPATLIEEAVPAKKAE